MQKASTVVIGLVLIMFGAATLAVNSILPALGVSMDWLLPWRAWPMLILAVGSVLFLLALFSIKRPGWGALFIPAIPVNMVGALLLFSSVFDQWHIWSFAWSFIIVALAVGFLLAMIFTRNVWLGIPAIIIGANALVLTFCSLSGLWSWWTVLWTIEPFTLGLVFLLISFKTHSAVMLLLGLIFCGFATLAFSLMSGIAVFGDWFFRLSGPALLILLGIVLLGWNVVHRPALAARG